MEVKASFRKAGGFPPDCDSGPEDKEISDDDDDDRNHKHRRQETWSQSMERDSVEQLLIRPYGKRNKPFENGHFRREPLEKELSAKFEKRLPGLATYAWASNRVNQSLSAELGPCRGRGTEPGSWSPRDPRFSSFDIVSPMVPQPSVHSSLFPERGFPNVADSQSASWSAFGLITGVANGGLNTLRSIGLKGTLRSTIGLPRQRCTDFEEHGFCLQGDMCPMEHGVNRIAVEDVQLLQVELIFMILINHCGLMVVQKRHLHYQD